MTWCAFYTFANGKDSFAAEYLAKREGIRHRIRIKPRNMAGNCSIGLLVHNSDCKRFLAVLEQRSIQPAYCTQIKQEEEPKWRKGFEIMEEL